MMHAGEGMSGGGTQWSLRHQCFWSTKAEGTGEFDIASPPRWYEPRLDLDVTYAKIAPVRRVRKWHTDHLLRKIPVNIHNAKSRLVCEVRP